MQGTQSQALHLSHPNRRNTVERRYVTESEHKRELARKFIRENKQGRAR